MPNPVVYPKDHFLRPWTEIMADCAAQMAAEKKAAEEAALREAALEVEQAQPAELAEEISDTAVEGDAPAPGTAVEGGAVTNLGEAAPDARNTETAGPEAAAARD